MSDEPLLLKLDVQVKKHTTGEEADKEKMYGIILRNKKGDAIKVNLKIESVNPNLHDEFILQEWIQVILTNPQTRLPTEPAVEASEAESTEEETSVESTEEETSTEQPVEEH